MNKQRKYYEKKFAKYPDVVDLLTFQEMLGGIGDSFARRLIHENRIAHTFIKPRYRLFKKSIIDYVQSEDWLSQRNDLSLAEDFRP